MLDFGKACLLEHMNYFDGNKMHFGVWFGFFHHTTYSRFADLTLRHQSASHFAWQTNMYIALPPSRTLQVYICDVSGIDA